MKAFAGLLTLFCVEQEAKKEHDKPVYTIFELNFVFVSATNPKFFID